MTPDPGTADFEPDPSSLTPVQKVGRCWVKRDDLFEVGGVNGGKARACLALARSASVGLVTASARQSPQSAIVAAIARRSGLLCRVHTAAGSMTEELEVARQLGARLIFHRPGYNSVIVRRALDDGDKNGWTVIPFGMACSKAVALTARQVANIPRAIKRIVVPVGSGLTLAGILTGLASRRRRTPILGIVVGADPSRRLDRWAPQGWRDMVELRRAALPYHRRPSDTHLDGIPLDPIYEAKCLPYLTAGDCLWAVGRRTT